MKKVKLILCTLFISMIALTAFVPKLIPTGSIKGTVIPADGALNAYAIMGTDTAAVNVISGSFELKNLRPGTYVVLIKTTAPFKPVVKPNIVVRDGEINDLGEIKLQ